MRNWIISSVLIIICLFPAFSQSRIVKITGNDLMTNYLKEGTNQYLVYTENDRGAILSMSIWERNISFSKKNTEDVIIVNQHWRNQDSTKSRRIYSINKKDDFYPVFHFSESGKGVKEAFNFTPDTIKGADSISFNSKKNFSLELKEPVFNWELDMELFQCLPYEPNTTFRINFYQAGSTMEPNFYDYKVIGEEMLDMGIGCKEDCWLLKIDYGGENFAIYWINKKTRELLKMEEKWEETKRYKIKFT